MKKIAVITGDIVHSREMDKEYRNEVVRTLKKVYVQSCRKLSPDQEHPDLEFFRGDSFQALVNRPEYAFRISLLIRSKIRSLTANKKSGKQTSMPLSAVWDARIAVGVGEADFRTLRIVESDGTVGKTPSNPYRVSRPKDWKNPANGSFVSASWLNRRNGH